MHDQGGKAMKARQFGAGTLAAVTCAVLGAGSAWACGDKLVALGGGVGFQRVVVSRHPGNIIIVLEPASRLDAATERFNLVTSLSLAGHEVSVARNNDELREQRAAVKPDLILVDADYSKQYDLRAAAGGNGPAIIPVSYSEGGQIAVSNKQSGCGSVDVGRKGSQLLKAVEGAMKLRSRGQPMPCDETPASQQT
jgi:hypothetical protein